MDVVNAAAILHKRKKLSRAYDLVAKRRAMLKGYIPISYYSKLQYFIELIEYQFLTHYFGAPPAWRLFLRKLNRKRTLPDFCVVGPIKSGTSDLAISLLLHPNVMLPLAKEIQKVNPENWRIFYPTERQKKEHASHYGSALSPYLEPSLHRMEMIYKLSRARPDTKIVLTLRDPVKRFYSHWKWEVFLAGKKRANALPFLNTFPKFVDKSLDVFPESPMFTVSGFQPLQTSIYWKPVKYWIDCFGRDNVLVLDVGNYFIDKNQFLSQIYEFVGLPSFDCPIFDNKINENPITLPPPDEESLAKLRDFFKPHNEKLWRLLGREFNWS